MINSRLRIYKDFDSVNRIYKFHKTGNPDYTLCVYYQKQNKYARIYDTRGLLYSSILLINAVKKFDYHGKCITLRSEEL